MRDAFIVSEIGQCLVCSKDTRFIEVNFETHLHPGPCEERLWADYWEASEG